MRFRYLMPLFEEDGGGSGGWGDFIQSEIAQELTDHTPADDGQPLDVDPDAQPTNDNGEPPAEGQDEVKPDPDEADPNKEAPVFNDETDVELGEGRQPVKLAELKQGYLRQSDYTKKTQALADERTTFEAERTALEPARKHDAFIKANPYLYQKFNEAVQAFQSTGVLPLAEVLDDVQYGQYINHLMAENNRLSAELNTASGKLGDMEFSTSMNSVITELKADYGDLITPEYEQELRDQAKTEKLKPELIKKMAKGDLAEKKLKLQPDPKTLTKETQAKTVQQLQEQRKTLPPQPRSSGQRPANDAPDESSKSWMDIARESMV